MSARCVGVRVERDRQSGSQYDEAGDHGQECTSHLLTVGRAVVPSIASSGEVGELRVLPDNEWVVRDAGDRRIELRVGVVGAVGDSCLDAIWRFCRRLIEFRLDLEAGGLQPPSCFRRASSRKEVDAVGGRHPPNALRGQ